MKISDDISAKQRVRSFRSQARKYLKQLVELSGETAELSSRVKDQLILIEQGKGRRR
jgi:DNA-binding IclR family transcriptional regulator